MLNDKQMGALVGVKVQVKPSRGTGKNGPTVAMLKQFDAKWAWIVPANHKRQERVPRENVVFWKKGLGLNPSKYEQVIDLFEKPVTITDKNMKTEYIIICKAYQLFWCGDRFSHNIKDAQTYTNLRGPRVAVALFGKGRKNDKRLRWEHICSGAAFEILPVDEVLKLAKKWKTEERKASFYNEEALKDPYYLYNKKSLEEPKEKTVESPVVKEVDKELSTEEIKQSVHKSQVIGETLKIIGATPPPPVVKVTAVQARTAQEASTLKRYAAARRQIVEAQALLAEAEQEMRAVEAELDIIKLQREFHG